MSGSTDDLLDNLAETLLDGAPVRPSAASRAGRLLDVYAENLEERVREDAWEEGAKYGIRSVDVTAILGAVLDVVEERVGAIVFDRAAFEAAYAHVDATGQRGTLKPRLLLPGSVEVPVAAGPRTLQMGDVVVPTKPWSWEVGVVYGVDVLNRRVLVVILDNFNAGLESGWLRDTPTGWVNDDEYEYVPVAE